VSTSEPGASVPKLADPDRRFFAWRNTHPNVAEDPRAAWAEAWRQAYWAGVKENTRLGLDLMDVAQRVEALERRLRDHDADLEIERELEASSQYWRSEGVDA
jgi:hypothetical protein